jgi:hypothetical protein
MGEGSPWLTEKAFGRGRFIWYAPMQPFIGHGGWSPSTHASLILRSAIEWAFEASRLPVMKLSPWRFPHEAAVMVRHDLENYAAEIANVERFAEFENSLGAKGSYYFCTGTLREDMDANYDTNAVIESLRRAMSNYNCIVGPHNGGLPNPANSPPLAQPDYDYWHWGPDEALDLSPQGYASGRDYARISISNSVADVERWFPGLLTVSNRTWVAPYFNATREPSLEILAGLNLKVAGEQKLSPFPHWTVSTGTSGKRFNFISVPVSDWFVGTRVAQSIEAGHTEDSIHAAVDYYYQMGGLINLYGHLLRTNGLQGEYVRYAMDTNLHPRVWGVNAQDLYQWWTNRSKAHVTAEYQVSNTNQAIATFRLSGATDAQTAVELLIPDSGTLGNLAVFTNGMSASPAAFRVNERRVKVLVGSTITNAQVRYTLGPRAGDDSFTASSGPIVEVTAPGVLQNDTPGLGGGSLTPILVTTPTHGEVLLQADGSFIYTPGDPSSTTDEFSYRVDDGVALSPNATVNLSFGNRTYTSDDFTRSEVPAPVAPWLPESGNWVITNAILQAGPNTQQTYSHLYLAGDWQDCTLEARIRFDAGAFGGGLGGRVDPATGARYAAWIYPEGSEGGEKTLRLVRFYNWTSWTLMQEVSLAAVGTNWHHLKLAFNGNQIAVWLDEALLISTRDESSSRKEGGVSLELWTAAAGYRMFVDDFTVASLMTDDVYEVVQGEVLSIAAPGVLANDTDPYGQEASAFLLKSPAQGSLDLAGNGSFSYVPHPGFVGQDMFIYETRSGTNRVGTGWGILNVLDSGGTGNAPRITTILRNGNTVTLSWTAIAARTYRLQYKLDIQDNDWVDVTPDITATSTIATGSDPNATAARKFYRVLLLP